jgi:aryl-alcohol dehydrogenase-like predicted oxidoreductase
MNYRFMGRTGVKVSSLCFGTMTFGTEADEATAVALFQRCRDAGINFFDCANVYGSGRAEQILGRLLSANGSAQRDQIVLATKAYFPTSPDVNARGTSRYHLVRAVEASLRRLNTDRIDLFYLHRFDDNVRLEETLRGLEDLVRQGKVLYPAASNFAAWQIARAIGHAEHLGFTPFAAIQPMYNLLKRQAEVELLPLAAAEGLGVFPYSPIGGGLLSGKYAGVERPESGRFLTNKMYQVRYGDAQYQVAIERFTALARTHGYHPAALAVAWVATHPAVTAPIIGARSLEQLESVLPAADIQLSPELRAELAALTPTPPPATDRNEELESGTKRHDPPRSATN